MSLIDQEAKQGHGQYMQKVDGSVIHPKMETFFKEFIRRISATGFNALAGKLMYLRMFLQTQRIPFNLVLSVMERHNCTEQEMIKGDQLTDLLHDIYYAANKLDLIADPWQWDDKERDGPEEELNPEEKAAQLASLLCKVYDLTQAKSLSVLEVKISLLLLCSTNSTEELIQHYLHLLIDHNRCIHQTRFRSMTVALLKFFHYLHEPIKCDSEMISIIVANAFAKVTGLAGLSDTQFTGLWHVENRKNTNEITYFLNVSLHERRLEKAASSVIHEGISCSGCNISPIKGFRFKCSRCSSVDLCLLCFLQEFKSDRHNPISHKLIEIQEPGSEVRGMNVFAKLLRVFYFMRSKRRANNEETDKNTSDGDQESEETLTNGQEPLELSGAPQGKDKLFNVIEMLSMENRLFQKNLEQIQQTCNPGSEFHKYLEQHKNILTEQIEHLRAIWKQSEVIGEEAEEGSAFVTPIPTQKFHSTPFRPNMKTINWDLTAFDASQSNEAGKSKYIRGEELNKSYFEANRSTRSLQEISTWLHMRESFCREMMSFQENLENAINCKSTVKSTKGSRGQEQMDEPGIHSFKILLHKVRDILEDTYSDNAQLSSVTRQLETVLDNIIGEEERKRHGNRP